MTMNIKRRRLIIAALGTLVAGGAASVGYLRQSETAGGWISAMLARHLPGVEIDSPSVARFTEHALGGLLLQSSRRWLVLLDSTLPVVTRNLPITRSAVESLERRLLSEFLVGSNFFTVANPRRGSVQFLGTAIACSNPFAIFVDQAATNAGSAAPAGGSSNE